MISELNKALYRYFGFQEFRQGQKEIIEEVLSRNNVLGVLPTGTGKSICYQLPARLLKGTVVVVSPLISLMIDQVKQLKAGGFKEVIAFNSFMSYHEKKRAFADLQAYKLIYVSPEMLQNEVFLQKLSNLTISLFVIDEAHCISQWGHEFRPDYLKLAAIIRKLQNPPVMALSATATPEVQEDIIRQLELNQVKKYIFPMDRKNISFVVKQMESNESKIDYLAIRFASFPGPTMVYFSSREWTEKAAGYLSNRLPDLNIAFYHGGMEQEDRVLIQQQFMNGQLDIVCCTSAFGMGINKPDIRLVVHFHLPSQVESFIQEVGRAGRDGKQSASVVLFAANDDYIPRKLIESELPKVREIDGILQTIRNLEEQKGKLPKEEEILEQLGINETQWRFLRYHLEKQGMIGIKPPKLKSQWITVGEVIKQTVTSRNRYKQEKLSELLLWAHSNECRRKSLFAAFQESVQVPEKDCCDVCGFDIDSWSPSYRSSRYTQADWKQELRQLMLRERLYSEN